LRKDWLGFNKTVAALITPTGKGRSAALIHNEPITFHNSKHGDYSREQAEQIKVGFWVF